jgi:nitrogenase-associated protein
MTIILFFGKPGCINNEKQKTWLTDAGHSVEDISILSHPWTKETLRPFFGEMPVSEWFNPTAPAITRGGFNPDTCTEDQALNAMISDKLLIKRPLMEIEGEKIVGFSPVDLDIKIGGLAITLGNRGMTIASTDMTTCPHTGSDANCDTKANVPEANWSVWLREGRQYFKAGSGEKSRFNNAILYNLLAMSFEKFVMAILGYHLSLPINHTFTDLIYSLEKFYPLDTETRNTLLKLETIQEICSFEDCMRADVSDEDIRIMRETIRKFDVMASDVCVKANAPKMVFA